MVEDASDVLWAIEVDGVELTRVKPGESVVVGRKPIRPMVEADADRRVDVADSEKSMSKRHAKLTVDAYGRAMLEDLGSTNGTFVVRDDGGLMRVPLGTQITFQRSPMHLQFGDKAVDFREVSSDDTGEHPVQSLFENLTPDQIANAANGAMSVDQILDVRAGEPTTAFDANAVRGRVHELNTAHLVQSYVTTNPAPDAEWDGTHGPTGGAEDGAQGSAQDGAQGSVLAHNGVYSHVSGIVTESVVAENVVAHAAAHDDSDEANAGILGVDGPSINGSATTAQGASDGGDSPAQGALAGAATNVAAASDVAAASVVATEPVIRTASVEPASTEPTSVESASTEPVSTEPAFQPSDNETDASASQSPDAAGAATAPIDAAEGASQSQQDDGVSAGAAAVVNTAESPNAAESADTVVSTDTAASTDTPESADAAVSATAHESEGIQAAGTPHVAEEETQSPADSQSSVASSRQAQVQEHQPHYQAQNEASGHEASYPVTASFPIRRTYSQATNYSGDYQTTDSSTWPATGQHHGFDSEAANLSAASAAAQTYPATAQGTFAAASDARFRPQREEDERFAVHQQSQQETHESRGGSDNTSAFAKASFSTPVTNPRYDAGSVLDRLSNGQFPAQQAESEDDRLIDGFSIRQARTTADYQQQFRMAQHPQLLPFLAMNPSLYGDLYAWLAAQGNADVESALNGNAGYLAWKQGK